MLRQLRPGLLHWAVSVFCALIGALMLTVPHQFASPSFAPLRPWLVPWGAAFFAAEEGKTFATRRVCVAGDSVNDIPLFRYFRNRDALRIFVGDVEEFEMVTGGGESALCLSGNMEGTAILLDELLRL